MTNRVKLGWSEFFDGEWQKLKMDLPRCVPARVVAEQRGMYSVSAECGELLGETAGRLRHRAERRADLPAVGDWVALEARPDEGRGTIHAVLPRRGCFARKEAGRRTDEQVIAANVDSVLVVTSLNNDLNARRIERYLAQVWESGAAPVVVLNKADLCDDALAETLAAEMEAAAIGVAVLRVSAVTGAGFDELTPFLQAGQTIALLGSSGVGKSTIINRLLGRDAQVVRDIRSGDDRGRHTTSVRQLFALPGGALVIDTPGMRELQLWSDGAGLDRAFGDVEELARDCRFPDCSHESEPGCAIQEALSGGRLDAERLESWRKLQRELAFLERKRDAGLQSAEREKWKQIHREMRRTYKERDKPSRG